MVSSLDQALVPHRIVQLFRIANVSQFSCCDCSNRRCLSWYTLIRWERKLVVARTLLLICATHWVVIWVIVGIERLCRLSYHCWENLLDCWFTRPCNDRTPILCRHQISLHEAGTFTEQLIRSTFFSWVPKSGKWMSILISCRNKWFYDWNYSIDSERKGNNQKMIRWS